MTEIGPSRAELLVLLIQASDLVTELLDVIDANGIARPVALVDRLDLFLVEASEAGLNVTR